MVKKNQLPKARFIERKDHVIIEIKEFEKESDDFWLEKVKKKRIIITENKMSIALMLNIEDILKNDIETWDSKNKRTYEIRT